MPLHPTAFLSSSLRGGRGRNLTSVLASKLARLAAAIACSVILGGCAGRTSVESGGADSPTRGIAFLLDEQIPTQSKYRRFELLADGTLKVGGGQAALLHKTDWERTLSGTDLQSVLDAIEAARLDEGPPRCEPRLVDGEESQFTRIEYASPSGTFAFDVQGRCPSIEPIRAALERLALSRYQRSLDALPEPGLQQGSSR